MMKKQILKICVAAVLLVAMLTGVCACTALQTPEQTLKSAYKKNIDEFIDNLDSLYENTGGIDLSSMQNMTMELDIGVELSDVLLNLLNSASETELSWEWLNDTTIHLSETTSGDKINMDIALGFKDKQLISANAIMDMAAGDIFLAIPLLTAKYLKISTEDMSDVTLPDMTQGADLSKILPEQKVLEDLIYKYFDLIMQSVAEVEKVDATITAGGVSQKCSALEFTLTQRQVADLIINVLTEAKQDNDLKNIIYSAVEYILSMQDDMQSLTMDVEAPYSADEAYAEFVDGCNDAIESLNESIADGEITDETMVSISNFVNSKTDIIGIDATFTADDESFHIFIGTAENDGNVGIQLFAEDISGKKLFEFVGKSTEVKDVLSGSYELLIDGESMLFIDLENMQTTKEGYANGSITLSPSSGLIALIQDALGMDDAASVAGVALSSMSLKFDLEQVDEKQIKTTIHVMSGRSDYIAITLDATISEAADVVIPTDFTESADDWAAEFDFNALLTQVQDSELPDFIVELVQLYVMMLQWS